MDNTTCINNIYALAKIKKVKIGDLEEQIGLSKGYLARIKREGGNSFPTVDKLAEIADILEVNLDSLLNCDLSKMGSSEVQLLSFINKLAENSENYNMVWKYSTVKDTANNLPDVLSTYAKERKRTYNHLNDHAYMRYQDVKSIYWSSLPVGNSNIALIKIDDSVQFTSDPEPTVTEIRELAIFNESLDIIYSSGQKHYSINKALYHLQFVLSNKIYTNDDSSNIMQAFLDFDFGELEK